MDMNIIMNDSHILSLEQVEKIFSSSLTPAFSFESHEKAYTWTSEVLDRFRYHEKGRPNKEKKKTGTLKYGKGKKRHQVKKIYPMEDARLIAEPDNAYRRMSGDAMRKVFEDEFMIYGKSEYEIGRAHV